MQSVKIEAGLSQLVERRRRVQSIQSNEDTPLQRRSDFGGPPCFEELS